MTYNAELQMLREFAHFWMPAISCFFCGKPLLRLPTTPQTFGHRRHPKVYTLVTIHHIDLNRDNNDLTNLRWCHTPCHKAYHQKLLLHGANKGASI